MSKIVYTSCPICESDQLKLKLELKDYSISQEAFEIVSCGKCDFHFTQNVPDEAHAGPYYHSEDYISHSDTQEGFINNVYHKVRNYMLKRKYKLVSRFSKGRKLLDVGAGTGYFASFMKGKGFDVKGVEIDPEARSYSIEKFGLDVVPPSDFIEGKMGGKFDTITLWHVLEHLYDLNGFMKNFHSHLEEDGTLVIAVPNFTSLDAGHYGKYWAAYDVPRHLWHFSPDSLDKLAKKHGFKVVQKNTMPFDPFYNSMLSEKLKKSSLQLFKGFFFGYFSFWWGIFNVDKSSSVIYVLKKV